MRLRDKISHENAQLAPASDTFRRENVFTLKQLWSLLDSELHMVDAPNLAIPTVSLISRYLGSFWVSKTSLEGYEGHLMVGKGWLKSNAKIRTGNKTAPFCSHFGKPLFCFKSFVLSHFLSSVQTIRRCNLNGKPCFFELRHTNLVVTKWRLESLITKNWKID